MGLVLGATTGLSLSVSVHTMVHKSGSVRATFVGRVCLWRHSRDLKRSECDGL